MNITREQLWRLVGIGRTKYTLSDIILLDKTISMLASANSNKDVKFDLPKIKSANNYIFMVKVVRETLSLGLAEAKTLVDSGVIPNDLINPEIYQIILDSNALP